MLDCIICDFAGLTMRGQRARTAHTGDGSEPEEDQSTIDIDKTE